MYTSLKILLLEDSRVDAEIIQRLLKKELPNCELVLATNKKGFLETLNVYHADVVLSDNSLPGFSATEALQIVRQQLSHIPFILVTGTVSEEFAAGIIKQGADDYILKDRLTRLPNAILTAYKNRQDEAERRRFQEELLEREQQLELFIMHSPASLAMFDTAMKYLAVSNRWCTDYNLDSATLIGASHYDIFPEIPQRWKAIHARCLKGAIEKNEEDLLIRSDGSESWLRWEIRPWYKASGDIGGIIIFTEDITHKRKAAEEILQSKLRLQQAQEIAHLGNWEINFETRTSKWSEEAYHIYGLPVKEHNILVDEWLAFIHPDDLEMVKAELEACAATLSDFAIEHRIIRRDGTIRYVYSQSRYELDGLGRPIGLYGVVHDITERKLAEEELKQSNERFKYAAQATLDIIWELNFEIKQYLVHEGGEKLFGIKRDLGWNTGVEGKYIHADDREMVRVNFREARLNPACELWKYEYRMITTEGQTIYIINHAIFIRDENGKALRAIGAITDITDKKRLQQELVEKEKEEQIRIAASVFEAQEKERASIGQELHDNINQILVGTNLLLSTIKGIHEGTDSIVNLSMDNIKNAIQENRKIAHELVGPDLKTDTLVNQLQTLTTFMLGPVGVTAQIEAAKFDESCLDTPQKLAVYRIAQEQCTNIVKYSGASLVTIVLESTGNDFMMRIGDNGKGMVSTKKITGIGIRNINNRLRIFNGVSAIQTSPGNGFVLDIRMPCKMP